MSRNPVSDGHKLAMTLTDDGGVIGKVICPFGGDPPQTAPCSYVVAHGEPVFGCFVVENFDAIGMEIFRGKVELPTIDIDWWDDGDFSEPEMWIRPSAGGHSGGSDTSEGRP